MILSIETSTEVCSVAIHKNGQLIDCIQNDESYAHAEKLAPIIDQILKSNTISTGELLAIAVASGPGSYTGLRIGISTAKGLCFALDIPLIEIATLESMLVGIDEKYADCLRCPMIDARRMEVYTLLAKADGQLIEATHAKIIDNKSFSSQLSKQKIVFYGNGAEKCKSVITSKNAKFIDKITPTAANIGNLAFDKYKSGDFADLAYFEPGYLKEFKAIKAKNPLYE